MRRLALLAMLLLPVAMLLVVVVVVVLMMLLMMLLLLLLLMLLRAVEPTLSTRWLDPRWNHDRFDLSVTRNSNSRYQPRSSA